MSHQESLLSSSSSSSSSSPPTLWHPLHQVSNLCRLIHHQPPIRCKAPAVATHWLWTNLNAALVRTKSTIGGTCCGHSENCTLRLPQLWHSWRVNQNKWNLNTRIQFESDGRCKDCGKRLLYQLYVYGICESFSCCISDRTCEIYVLCIMGKGNHGQQSSWQLMDIRDKCYANSRKTWANRTWQEWAKYIPQSLSTRTFEKKINKKDQKGVPTTLPTRWLWTKQPHPDSCFKITLCKMKWSKPSLFRASTWTMNSGANGLFLVEVLDPVPNSHHLQGHGPPWLTRTSRCSKERKNLAGSQATTRPSRPRTPTTTTTRRTNPVKTLHLERNSDLKEIELLKY